MAEMLNKDYGSVDFDNLVIRGGAVGSLQLAAGQGTLARGTVLDGDGAALKSGATAKYILADEVVTDDSEITTGIVYKTGVFVRNSLIAAAGYEFTNANAEELRDVGIVVEDAK